MPLADRKVLRNIPYKIMVKSFVSIGIAALSIEFISKKASLIRRMVFRCMTI